MHSKETIVPDQLTQFYMTLFQSTDSLSCVHTHNYLLTVEAAVHSPDRLIRSQTSFQPEAAFCTKSLRWNRRYLGFSVFFTSTERQTGDSQTVRTAAIQCVERKECRNVETRKLIVLVCVLHQLKVNFAQGRWQSNCQLATYCNLLFKFYENYMFSSSSVLFIVLI